MLCSCDFAQFNNNNNNNKTLFQEGNTISTKLISLAALKYLQIHKWMNEMKDSDRWHDMIFKHTKKQQLTFVFFYTFKVIN